MKDTSFEIPRRAVSYVIGEHGIRIQNTKNQSRVLRIDTMQRYTKQQTNYNDNDNDNVTFVIIGTKDNVRIAKQMLQQQALYALTLNS